MDLQIAAMGQTLKGSVDDWRRASCSSSTCPAALSFVEPMIRRAVEKRAQKLLG